MNVIASLFMLAGGLVAVLAAAGLLRFRTAYARFHAAGKASPAAFLLTAVGAAIALGPEGAAMLGIAAIAIVLTVPMGVHLLFRAVYRAADGEDLRTAEGERSAQG